MFDKVCPKCNSEYSSRKSTQIYCSVECAKGRYEEIVVQCLSCNTDIETKKGIKRERKFCSRQCANAYHFPKRERLCPDCGIEVTTKGATFCSQTCYRRHERKVYISAWKSGEESGTTGKKFKTVSKYVRTHLFEINNNSCQICGWSQKNQHTLTIPLEIHHLDGDYLNNRPENLQLICPNCHSLTKGYKGANAGKGNSEKRIGGGREDHWKRS